MTVFATLGFEEAMVAADAVAAEARAFDPSPEMAAAIEAVNAPPP